MIVFLKQAWFNSSGLTVGQTSDKKPHLGTERSHSASGWPDRASQPLEELFYFHARIKYNYDDEKWYEDNLVFGKTEVEISSWSQNESNSSLGFVRDQTLPDPSNRLIYPILNDRIVWVSMMKKHNQSVANSYLECLLINLLKWNSLKLSANHDSNVWDFFKWESNRRKLFIREFSRRMELNNSLQMKLNSMLLFTAGI